MEVRNPVLALPGFRRLRALPPGTRLVLASILDEIAADARARADQCWKKHKAPMAAYWKAVAVYAGHISRGLKRADPPPSHPCPHCEALGWRRQR